MNLFDACVEAARAKLGLGDGWHWVKMECTDAKGRPHTGYDPSNFFKATFRHEPTRALTSVLVTRTEVETVMTGETVVEAAT